MKTFYINNLCMDTKKMFWSFNTSMGDYYENLLDMADAQNLATADYYISLLKRGIIKSFYTRTNNNGYMQYRAYHNSPKKPGYIQLSVYHVNKGEFIPIMDHQFIHPTDAELTSGAYIINY